MLRIPLNIQRFGVTLSVNGTDNVISGTNTSQITGTITISTNGQTHNTGGTAYYTVNGGPANYFNIGYNSTVSFNYTSGPYQHKQDGSLENQTISVYVYITSSSSTSGNISVKMQTIPRYPKLNYGSDFTDDTNPVYNITSYDTYPIRIKLEAGGNPQLIIRDVPKNTSGNYTLVLTEAERKILRDLTPDTNILPVTETVCAMSGNNELSASYKSYKMTINLAGRIRINGEWIKSTPYVRVSGEWKKATPYVRNNNEWKRGK